MKTGEKEWTQWRLRAEIEAKKQWSSFRILDFQPSHVPRSTIGHRRHLFEVPSPTEKMGVELEAAIVPHFYHICAKFYRYLFAMITKPFH